MNYCPHCGESLRPEVKKPLTPGLPIPPCDTTGPHWEPPFQAPYCPPVPYNPLPLITWTVS